MSLADFKSSPWRRSHKIYDSSVFAMSPAPEYASSEVVLSSLYRFIGYAEAPESGIPARGREIERSLQKALERGSKHKGAVLDARAFHTLLHSVLESPKLPNQSTKRFIQSTPIVPQVATFSGSARLSSNSWPAGDLVRSMVWLGAPDSATANKIWSGLFDALSVSDSDDVFSKFVADELSVWTAGPTWKFRELDQSRARFELNDFAFLSSFPSKQFVRDLQAIIESKDAMTRRQWISLLEAILRLASVSHIIWICMVQANIWSCIRSALRGEEAPTELELQRIIFPEVFSYLSYGDRAVESITDLISGYLDARLSINATLWLLSDIRALDGLSMTSTRQVHKLCSLVRKHHAEIKGKGLLDTIEAAREQESAAMLCKKGIGSNIKEFARHALGQRQVASEALRGYDQGYVLRKKSVSAQSPWVVGLGPVAALALVHCSLADAAGPRSVHRLALHLSTYGISIDHQKIAENDLGSQLRMLGLVLDSPDAESGMLLVPPFGWRKIKGTNA